MNMWEVIQTAEEEKLEVSYRWFRTYKDAEDFCFGLLHPGPLGPPKIKRDILC